MHRGQRIAGFGTISWVVLFVLVGHPLRIRAQAHDASPVAVASEVTERAEPVAYAEHVRLGLAAYERGDYAESRVQFLAAHALAPSARTLRGLGKVEFELHDYGAAAQYLTQALADDRKPLDATLRAETEQLLARARVYVGEVHITIEPQAATISVNGVTTARGPEASLLLPIGEHILDFSASGRLPERRVIHIDRGAHVSVRITLAGLVPAPAAAQSLMPMPDSDTKVDRERTRKRRLWLGIAGATLVAAAVTAAVVAVHRNSSHEASDDPVLTSATIPGVVVFTGGGQP